MEHLRQISAFLWAAPNTILGIGLGFLLFDRPKRLHQAVIFEGSALLQYLGVPPAAITLGHVILATRHMPPQILAHELIHVRQYECWGPLLIPAWLVGLLVGAVRTRQPYLGNPFEREAFLLGEGGVPLTPRACGPECRCVPTLGGSSQSRD